MWPPIEVRKKHDASETGPVQVGFTLGRRRRTFQSKRTLPQLTRFARRRVRRPDGPRLRSEEHTSELQSHSFISYAVFCLKKKIHPRRPFAFFCGPGDRALASVRRDA